MINIAPVVGIALKPKRKRDKGTYTSILVRQKLANDQLMPIFFET